MAVVLARGAGFGWGLPVRLRGAVALKVTVTLAGSKPKPPEVAQCDPSNDVNGGQLGEQIAGFPAVWPSRLISSRQVMRMGPVLSGPHQKFAEGIALGLNATDAYVAAYPASTRVAASPNAARLIRNDKVLEEVERLRRKAEEAAGGVVLTLVEKRTILAQIARGGERDGDRINAIKADNDLGGDGADATLAIRIVKAWD